MTLFKTTLLNTLKNTALVLVTGMLIACQAETSAETDSSAENKKSAPVATQTAVAPQADKAPSVAEPVETPAVISVPQTPKAPADFSQLDSNKYHNLEKPFPVSTGNDIEVAELFWFGCGHCFALEPHLKSWLNSKPANAKFKKVPAIFSKSWEFHGKAFYTMQALNVPDSAYDDFFSQIHVKKRRLNNLNALVSFLAPYGKDKKMVENAFDSFAVDSQLRNAIKITKASGARGVPAIVVDGKYLTSQTDAGSTALMFDVVDKLVAKSASER